MSHLLAITIGSVQEFLFTVQRTDELKAGAELLSELVRGVVEFLEQQDGTELVFPVSGRRFTPNRVLCAAIGEPYKLARAAKAKALSCLRARWEDAYRQMTPAVQRLIDTELVCWQLKNFMEFYAAWVPLEGDYGGALERLERILVGRMTLRDFKQPYKYVQHPKSPLNPALDSAFYTEAHGNGFTAPQAAQRDPVLRLKPRETLDAISLIKRVRGQRGVPSTRQIALRDFEPILPQEALDAYRALQHWQGRLGIEDLSDLFYQQNWRNLLKVKTGEPLWNLTEADQAEIEQSASKLQRALREKGIPLESLDYYAVLMINGDNTRVVLSRLESPKQHRAFSEREAEFAAQAEEVVAKHRGCLIYCGGDDTLALLPTTQALTCAHALRQRFERTLAPVMPDGTRATLSAGIAILHTTENLQVALDLALEALQRAKHTRDALALARRSRKGDTYWYSAPWTECREWSLDRHTTFTVETTARRSGKDELENSTDSRAR